MRNFMVINQKALSYLAKKHNVRIDFNTGAVFDYLKGMILSQSHKIIKNRKDINGLSFTKIYYSKILQDMPMLSVKTSRGLKERINIGVSVGLFRKHISKAEGNVLYFSLTELGYEILENSLTDEAIIDNLIEGKKQNTLTISKKEATQKKDQNPKPQSLPKEILEYLNQKANKNFRVVDGNTKFIKARLKEGYKLDDFKKVIDNKVSSWGGTEYAKYLQPKTLFSNKFDGYLNENLNDNQLSSVQSQKAKSAYQLWVETKYKKTLPTSCFGKIKGNKEEEDALKELRAKNKAWYDEVAEAYRLHAIREQKYAKTFLKYIKEFKGRFENA